MPGTQKAPARSAADYLPDDRSLASLDNALQSCRGCDLFKNATQAVFGEGAPNGVLFVGEQPGDAEDNEGRPFVGPAGKLLDRALEEAGISRDATYVTNAVKHFKFEWRGKKRLHQKPNRVEVQACWPWLEEEIKQIRPEIIVCLGATAAQQLIGRAFRVTRDRGQLLPSQYAPHILATVHPSSILRAPGDDARHAAFAAFVEDLKVVASATSGRKRRAR